MIQPGSWLGRMRRLLHAFGKDNKGVAALEFAMLAPLFLLMLFAILESCITFAAQQVLTNATDDIRREIWAGKIRPEHLTKTSLPELLCDRMPALFATGCPGLKVDVRHFDTFDQIAAELTKGIVPATFQIDIGPSMSKNVMRVFYEWPAFLSIFSDRVIDPVNNKTLLFATTTWQNEPFSNE